MDLTRRQAMRAMAAVPLGLTLSTPAQQTQPAATTQAATTRRAIQPFGT